MSPKLALWKLILHLVMVMSIVFFALSIHEHKYDEATTWGVWAIFSLLLAEFKRDL